MQRIGSTWIRPNGGLSSSGTQNIQSSTGQYSTQAGEPARALELWEQGRGVLLGQALDIRSDLSGVASSDPRLAERFAAVLAASP